MMAAMTPPWVMMQLHCGFPQVQKQLLVRIHLVLLPERTFLLFERLLYHASDRSLINIVSAWICHSCFLSMKKAAAVMKTSLPRLLFAHDHKPSLPIARVQRSSMSFP